MSCLYDNLVVRNHLSKLTKSKGGCTQVALVQCQWTLWLLQQLRVSIVAYCKKC